MPAVSVVEHVGHCSTCRSRFRAKLARFFAPLALLFAPQMSSAARERRDMLVLLLAVTFVVVPHFEHLVWWATSVLVLLLVMARVSDRDAATDTESPADVAAADRRQLVPSTCNIRPLVGQQAGVTFLLLLMALKLLEMRARRDIFVVIFLSFFILLTQFLNGQEIHVAVMALLGVVALFFVLISVNLDETDLPAGRKVQNGRLDAAESAAADGRVVLCCFRASRVRCGERRGTRAPATPGCRTRCRRARSANCSNRPRSRFACKLRRRDPEQRQALLARPGVRHLQRAHLGAAAAACQSRHLRFQFKANRVRWFRTR